MSFMKFTVNNCDACIDQTKRQLKTRIKEHINDIKLDTSKHCHLRIHSLDSKYRIKYFYWDKVKNSRLRTKFPQEAYF